MNVVPVTGFLSYVHDDDQTDAGRVLQLAADLQSEFAAITAGDLRLFVDGTSLEWGDDWRSKIDEAIAQAAFLIPIITPRYFASQACRDEILAFAAHAQAAGVPDLVLPVYWIDVRELENDPSVDEVTALVAARQRQDLRTARLEDRGSSVYRHAVNRLAQALAERSERASTVVTVMEPAGDSDMDEDNQLGPIETLAEGEGAFEEITPTLEEIGTQIEIVGNLMAEASAEMARADARGQGFAGRLRIATRLAEALKDPAARIAQLGQEYGAMMVKIDPMVRLLIDAGHRTTDADEQAEAHEMFRALEEMVSASEISLQILRELVDSAQEVASVSSTMRPVLRQLNRGLQGVLDSAGVFGEWKRLVGENGGLVEPPITKTVAEIHEEHGGRPLSDKEFEDVFGALPADSEG